MGRKKKDSLEFRFYEVPQGESALALLGEAWVGTYGHSEKGLHFHNLFEVGYCHFGRGKLLLGDRALAYEDAMISAIPAHYPHSTYSEDTSSWEYLFFDAEELLAEMYPDNPRRLAEKLFTVNKRASLLRIDEYPDLGSTVWRILEEARERRPYQQELMRGLLKIYLLELMRLQESELADTGWTERSEAPLFQVLPALRYIDEHYAEDLRVLELARQCGLSEPHFRRLFTEYVNMSPTDYRNMVRVRRACALMSRRDIPMDLVAGECGFASASAFSRNFKKFLDITPYQWKLREKKEGGRAGGYSISAYKGWDSAEK